MIEFKYVVMMFMFLFLSLYLIWTFFAKTLKKYPMEVELIESSKMAPWVHREPSIARFHSSNAIEREEAESYLSFAFDDEILKSIGEGTSSYPIQPIFTSDDKQFKVVINSGEGTSFYGGGEVSSGLELTGRKIKLWNHDEGYGPEHINLYQSHPYILGVRSDGTAFGVIADTTFMIDIELTENCITIYSSSDHDRKPVPFSVVIIDDCSPQSVTKTLARLTGYMQFPPKWSLGYQQSRWSYYPQSNAISIAKQFREHKIPCDVIWFDIHYMNGYRIFTFDPLTFPSPALLNQELHQLDFHSVWMIDPGVAKKDGYFVYEQLLEGEMEVRTAEGKPYVGSVWPGSCVFPDFTMEKTRKWWGDLYQDFMAQGIDGVWNDMNEPAIFDSPTETMPIDNIHRPYGPDGPVVEHAQYHNVYGMLMAKASKEGIDKANPNKRPFVLTRSNYLGGQKYAAMWTGDNDSTWVHLRLTIPMILNMSLSGQPFTGPDIGGFFNNATPTMFARWMGIGALLPFSRGHTHHDSIPHEPYAFDTKTTDTCRVAINRRYMLMPYYYTLFRRASLTGLPIVQPLFFADPADPRLRKEDRGFLIGDDIMVIADVYDQDEQDIKQKRGPVALPKNEKWYNLDLDGEHYDDLPDMKIRAGAIIPTQEVIQSTNHPMTRLILFVALKDNQAYGNWYEDSGDDYSYKNNNYLETSYHASLNQINSKVIFTLRIIESGHYPRTNVPITINIIHNAAKYQIQTPHNYGQTLNLDVTNLFKSLITSTTK